MKWKHWRVLLKKAAALHRLCQVLHDADTQVSAAGHHLHRRPADRRRLQCLSGFLPKSHDRLFSLADIHAAAARLVLHLLLIGRFTEVTEDPSDHDTNLMRVLEQGALWWIRDLVLDGVHLYVLLLYHSW